MFDRLQYISQGSTAEEQISNIQSALDAGCKWIQLRFKNTTEENLRQVAGKVSIMCRQAGAVFIVNDHVPIALETGADGVHLGLDDMPVAVARQLLGPARVIGGTANTLTDVLQRAEEGCSYIGLGPFRFTVTKEQLSPVLGPEGYRNILQQLPAGFDIPVYAIGGITTKDIPLLGDSGIYGIAVSGLITNATDKHNLIEKLKSELYATAGHCR